VPLFLCSLPPSLSPCVFQSLRKLPDIWDVSEEDTKMDQAFGASVESGMGRENNVNLRPIFGYWSPVGVSLTRLCLTGAIVQHSLC
jgi:hypothetical protein